MKICTTCLAMLFCFLAYCKPGTDTIYFTNGTKVIGKIKKIKLGVITFDPDDANDITVQVRKLKTIAGGYRIFRIENIYHQQYFGRIRPHPSSNMIFVELGNDTLAVSLSEVSVLYPFENTVFQRFSGTVGLGYSYTRSSHLGRLNFDGTIRYVSKKDEISLSLSGIYSISDTLFSRDNESVYLKYNYYFVRNWFATTFLAYQRNLELSLTRRYQEGLGIGNKFLTNKSMYAWGRGGLVLNQEKSTDGVESGILTELFGQIELNFFKFENPKINFLLTQTFYYSLSQSGRFRNDGSMSVTWEIFKDFKLSFEPYNNYDSKPPVSGSPNFDFGVVFGIKYIF